MRSAYRDFDATELYCPHCKMAVRVKKHLLLVLPEGEKYDYRCSRCGSPIGDKLDKDSKYSKMIRART